MTDESTDGTKAERLKAYLEKKLEGHITAPMEFRAWVPENDDHKLSIVVSGLTPAKLPEPSPYGKTEFFPLEGLKAISSESIGPVHRVLNAIDDLIAFGDRNRATQVTSNGRGIHISVNMDLVDLKLLEPGPFDNQEYFTNPQNTDLRRAVRPLVDAYRPSVSALLPASAQAQLSAAIKNRDIFPEGSYTVTQGGVELTRALSADEKDKAIGAINAYLREEKSRAATF